MCVVFPYASNKVAREVRPHFDGHVFSYNNGESLSAVAVVWIAAPALVACELLTIQRRQFTNVLRSRRLLGHDAALLMGVTLSVGVGVSMNFAQAAMSLRRFSNKSERRYAASLLSLSVCASAASATSRG